MQPSISRNSSFSSGPAFFHRQAIALFRFSVEKIPPVSIPEKKPPESTAPAALWPVATAQSVDSRVHCALCLWEGAGEDGSGNGRVSSSARAHCALRP